jgi:hypothetical protein
MIEGVNTSWSSQFESEKLDSILIMWVTWLKPSQLTSGSSHLLLCKTQILSQTCRLWTVNTITVDSALIFLQVQLPSHRGLILVIMTSPNAGKPHLLWTKASGDSLVPDHMTSHMGTLSWLSGCKSAHWL